MFKWFKVKVYNSWGGSYVGDGEYEGGSFDNYEFNSKYDDLDGLIEDIRDKLFYTLVPCMDVVMFKFKVYDRNGNLVSQGDYNETPYQLTKDKSKWSSLKLPYTRIQLSKVKCEY